MEDKYKKITSADSIKLGLKNSRNSREFYKIKTSTSTHEIQDLLRYVNDDQLVLPDMQRDEGAWGPKLKKEFIDSLFFNYPIPPMMILKHNNFKLLLDGQQRMACIRDFFNDKLKTKKYKDESISAKIYSKLPKDKQLELMQREILVQNVSQEYPDNANGSFVYEIFKRINTGSRKLKDQEVRFASFHGEFTIWFKELCRNQVNKSPFSELFKTDDYLSFSEFLLRTIAFRFMVKIDFENSAFVIHSETKKTLSLGAMLNDVMEILCSNQITTAKSLVNDTLTFIEKSLDLYESKTFKSISPSGKVANRIQLPLFDAYVSLSNNSIDPEGIETLYLRNMKLAKEKYDEYKNIFQAQSMSAKSVIERINFINGKI